MKRDTVGSIALGVLNNAQELDHSPQEQAREQLAEYESNFTVCVQEGMKIYHGDFYVVVETKKEPKLKNVLRNYFIHRSTCPTPTYDNVVYKFHRGSGDIEFLWVLPDKATYNMMLNHALEIPFDQKELLQFVLDDYDGTLLNICKKLNGEIK